MWPWFACWFSSLLQEVFLRVLRFSPLLKTNTSKFQFDVESFPNECNSLNTLTLSHYLFIYLFIYLFSLQCWRVNKTLCEKRCFPISKCLSFFSFFFKKFQVGKSLVCFRKGIPQSRRPVSNRVSSNGTSGNGVVNVEV